MTTQWGCVQRRLLIRSNPEGALVTVDGRPVGHTPYSLPFTYYGTRLVKLEKDGYQTTEVKQQVRAPWYQYPPFSFFADNLAFREIRDTREVDIAMTPKVQTNEDQLIQSANQLRQDVHRDTIISPRQ